MTWGSSFDSVFKALAGNLPFPWQTRFYQHLLAGKLPGRCDIPTGLGKTGVIAAWLAALGAALEDPVTGKLVPRRLVYVVDRRAVVDQATQEAEKLLTLLRDAVEGSVLAKLRASLVRASARSNSDDGGVAISTLRGQFADNHEWDHDAARPAIIVGTVDMIGSRLLFSGFGGLGRHRRSLHAGLLAQDALVVIDEAHLSPAFAITLEALRQQLFRSESLRPFQSMLLTATPSKLDASPSALHSAAPAAAEDIRLTEDDLAVEEVTRRFRARKTLCFRTPDSPSIEKKGKVDLDALAQCMAAEAVALAGSNGAVVIFANTVELLNRIDAGSACQMRNRSKESASLFLILAFGPGARHPQIVAQIMEVAHRGAVTHVELKLPENAAR